MGRLAFEKALQPNLESKHSFSKMTSTHIPSKQLFGAKLILRLSLIKALTAHKVSVKARVGDRLYK